MSITDELASYTEEGFRRAIQLAGQIDILGGTPSVDVQAIKISNDPDEMLKKEPSRSTRKGSDRQRLWTSTLPLKL